MSPVYAPDVFFSDHLLRAWRVRSITTEMPRIADFASEAIRIDRNGEQEMKTRSIVAGLSLIVAFEAASLCTPAAAQDVQAYCAKVRDDDRVQPVPGNLIHAARRMFEVPADASDSYVQAGTSIRCMNGAVWLCSYGANLVCDKADVSRDSYGAEKYCRQNPGSAGVPMSATGHATIYEWRCVGREARIARQSTAIDDRGFIAGNWKQLE